MASLLLLLLASCGSVKSKTFEILAIDTDRQPVKCVVVVDRSWPHEEGEAVFTDAFVDVKFDSEEKLIEVKAVETDEKGVPTQAVPHQSHPSRYLMEQRRLRHGDPPIQLFVLTLRR